MLLIIKVFKINYKLVLFTIKKNRIWKYNEKLKVKKLATMIRHCLNICTDFKKMPIYYILAVKQWRKSKTWFVSRRICFPGPKELT